MIPEFNADGNLPPGIYEATWAEFRSRYGTNLQRRRLLAGLALAIGDLQAAGCHRIYVNGSFVTAKRVPNDFDCCWDPVGVDLDVLHPALISMRRDRRAAQQARYMGDLFPADAPLDALATHCLEYFQHDKITHSAKGIIALNL